MRRLAVFALLIGLNSIAAAEVSIAVYLADGNTPLEWADPNVPYVYRDIMVGTKLTIIVSSDTGGGWSGGLEVFGDNRDYGLLLGRDYNDATRDWEGSHFEAAGAEAKVSGHASSFKKSFGLRGSSAAEPGDWFVIDYAATRAGVCTVDFYSAFIKCNAAYEYCNPFDPPSDPEVHLCDLVFSHVPTRDFFNDTRVDFTDFAILASYRGATDCADPDWCGGTDLDTDGDVDADDFTLFADYWLETSE